MSALTEATEAIDAGRYAEAAALLAPLINTGNAEADYLYGTLIFREADVVPVDDALAALRRAADLDHPGACFDLATTTVDDDGGLILGMTSDPELLLHAGELGHVEAQRRLGLAHLEGEDGFPEDSSVTRLWYQRAAEQGDAESQFDLGWMLLEGEGGPEDDESAFHWLETCALRDDPASETAADYLATIFEEGRFDFEIDPVLAEKWRRRQRELAEAARQREEAAKRDDAE